MSDFIFFLVAAWAQVFAIVEKNLNVVTDNNRNFDGSNRNFLQKVG